MPELGIKFLVTRDTKEDLGYSYKEYKGYNNMLDVINSLIYSRSETDKKLSGCILSEKGGWSCGFISISLIKEKEFENYLKEDPLLKDSWCDNFDGSFYVDNYIGCVTVMLNNVNQKYISDQQYRNFFHTPTDKNNKTFGIYLNTIQSTK